MSAVEITSAPVTADAILDCAADAIERGAYKGSPLDQAVAALNARLAEAGVVEWANEWLKIAGALDEASRPTASHADDYLTGQRDRRKAVRLFRRAARLIRANG